MGARNDDGLAVVVRKKWFQLGLVIAFLHAIFMLIIIGLLQVDQMLAILVAVVIGTVGVIVLTVFALYVYR